MSFQPVTLVTFPTSAYPTPHAVVEGTPYYTRIDSLRHYGDAHGMSVDQVLEFQSTYGVDVRDLEIKRHLSDVRVMVNPDAYAGMD